jgi:hypothetical protein
MDRRTLLLALLTPALLLVGAILGAVVQKHWGLGGFLALAGVTGAPPTSPAEPPGSDREPVGVPDGLAGQLQLFVLAGQSNMSGWGELPAEPSTHPRVFLFGNDYRWRVGREPLDDDAGQVDTVSRDGSAGFGPGMTFALSLIERRAEAAIGLIPCAKGASAIEEWQRSLSDASLYGSCLKRVRAAGTMGSVAGLLVFQGEADALDPARAPTRRLAAANYAERFSAFVTDFRRDLEAPRLPVVFAQIGAQDALDVFVNWEVVQDQQRSVSLPCAAMIATDDLPLMDGLHFTTDSYRVIGGRFADAYQGLHEAAHGC